MGMVGLLYAVPRAGAQGELFLAVGVFFVAASLLLAWLGSRWLRILLVAHRGGMWAECELCITTQRGAQGGSGAARYVAQVTDVASRAQWLVPLLNERSPSAAVNLATQPGRMLYVHRRPGGSVYPVAVQAGGTVHWAARLDAIK